MKDFKNANVFCKENDFGTMDFFLNIHNQEMYLFTTKYFSKNIFRDYSVGKRLESVYQNTKNFRQQKLKERILRMAKEKSELSVLTCLHEEGR